MCLISIFNYGFIFAFFLTSSVLVEVVEGGAELRKLFLRDALGVAREDLVLDLVDCAVDRRQQLFPADAESLHCVL